MEMKEMENLVKYFQMIDQLFEIKSIHNDTKDEFQKLFDCCVQKIKSSFPPSESISDTKLISSSTKDPQVDPTIVELLDTESSFGVESESSSISEETITEFEFEQDLAPLDSTLDEFPDLPTHDSKDQKDEKEELVKEESIDNGNITLWFNLPSSDLLDQKLVINQNATVYEFKNILSKVSRVFFIHLKQLIQ